MLFIIDGQSSLKGIRQSVAGWFEWFLKDDSFFKLTACNTPSDLFGIIKRNILFGKKLTV